MNPVHALAAWNRQILEAYSRRTTATLRLSLPLRVVLPRLEPFLALNVAKEVQKDNLIIQRVGEACAAGAPPGAEAREQLLSATKEIDRAFLAHVVDFPIGIVIPYDEIEPVRLRRIDRLLGAGYRILDAWRVERKGNKARAALQSCYPRADFERLLFDLLRLYAEETRALSRSLRLPTLLVPLRDSFAQSLYGVMQDVAVRLAMDLTRTVYRPGRS